MKNLLIVFLSVLAVFTVCMAVNAQDVPVSVTVPEESYQVSIPTNELFLREEPTNLTVSATNVKLLTGNRLSVTVSSQNRFFLTAADEEQGKESRIGYSMYYEVRKDDETYRYDVEQGSEILSMEGYGTADTMEPQNADVNLFLVLDKNGINEAAMAGKHTDCLTFTCTVSPADVY